MVEEMNRKAYYKRMLFDGFGTTTRADYQGGRIPLPTVTKYQKKPTCYRIRPPPLKDVHTLTNWKENGIPFDLLHKKRDMTDPRVVQKPYTKEVDHQQAEIQKTRPRLVMTPAVSMDDIENKVARDILINDMYTSNMTRATREAVSECLRVEAPFPGLPAPANPVSLPKSGPHYVSPEWRMETVTWDQKQLRCYCDTTAEFWLRRDISYCRACKESEIVTRDRNMKLAKPR